VLPPSDERFRGISGSVAVTIVSGWLMVSLSSCTTATDESGAPATDDGRADIEVYADSMNEICTASATEITALPTPPEAISQTAWAAEISRIFTAEAAAFDEVRATEDVRADHRTLIETTAEQAEQWSALSAALADDPSGATIGEITNTITELTLGRSDLVGEMNLPACRSDGGAT
jgi:hypothetical protein